MVQLGLACRAGAVLCTHVNFIRRFYLVDKFIDLPDILIPHDYPWGILMMLEIFVNIIF